MKSGDTSTHRPQAVNPADFKAQATGIGQTLAASRTTGGRAHSALPAARRRRTTPSARPGSTAAAESRPTRRHDRTRPEQPQTGMARAAAEGFRP